MLPQIFDLPAEHPASGIQIIGYIGMALGVITFLQKDDTRMKICMVLMTSVLVVHFILLGRYVAACSSAMAGSRAGLSIFNFVRRHAFYFTAFYTALACILLYFTYERWIDIFPFITAVMGAYAFFYLHGLWLRYAFLIAGILWLTHNILALSYGPAIMETFILIANLITIWRLRSDHKKLRPDPEAQF